MFPSQEASLHEGRHSSDAVGCCKSAAVFSHDCRVLIAQQCANENVFALHKMQMLSGANLSLLWGGRGKRADNIRALIGTTTVPKDVLHD